jgi:hypothetical protein
MHDILRINILVGTAVLAHIAPPRGGQSAADAGQPQITPSAMSWRTVAGSRRGTGPQAHARADQRARFDQMVRDGKARCRRESSA